MSSGGFNSTALQPAIQDHETVSLLVTNASRMLRGAPNPDTRATLEANILLIHKKLFAHFEYEEQHVFAPILAARPGRKVAALIASLTEEHQRLLKQIRETSRALSRHDFPIGAGAAWDALMTLLADLQQHATTEDALFLSLLEKDSLAQSPQQLSK